jgi:hypothetical protein
MNIKDQLRAAQEAAASGDTGQQLVVTNPHSLWMELPESEQIYSPAAKRHVWDAMSKKFKHQRTGRFSLSSIGMCPRRVVFGYAGAPQSKPTAESQAMMDNGTWAHLQWQAEGLTQEWMTSAEDWVLDTDLRAGGSRDGTLHDGGNFELKSCNQNIYRTIVGINRAPKYENLLQDAAYKLLDDLPAWSTVIYENRDMGAFHEFRVSRNTQIENEVQRLLKSYGSYVDNDDLPPMLEDCEAKVGWTYKSCPHKAICAGARTVSEFGGVT